MADEGFSFGLGTGPREDVVSIMGHRWVFEDGRYVHRRTECGKCRRVHEEVQAGREMLERLGDVDLGPDLDPVETGLGREWAERDDIAESIEEAAEEIRDGPNDLPWKGFW